LPAAEEIVSMRAVVAEGLGTAWLLMAVVGSGIMGDRLAGGSVALALLANSIATGAALTVLILTFGPISGAHLNPLLSVAAAAEGRLSWGLASRYIGAQLVGAFVGVAVANLMFDEPVMAVSQHARVGWALALSEVVATAGLIGVIWNGSRSRSSSLPFTVGAYITAAYWFTSSTSFANPAVTIARAATNTFTGIRPNDVPVFLLAQTVGATAAISLCRWLVPAPPSTAESSIVPCAPGGAGGA
jgi:glycerol uptake facilitator-like aquaporin